MAIGSAWAQAVGTTFTVDGFTFKILTKTTDNYTVQVNSFGSRTNMDVVIPTEAKEPKEGIVYKVTQINSSSPASIKSLTIPEGIQSITSLPGTSIGSSLYVPSTVTTLPSYFKQKDLATFTVDDNNQTFYTDENGILFKKSSDTNKKELVAYPLANATWLSTVDGKSAMVVPEGITHIPTNAISVNSLFEVFQLPSTLISMPTNMYEWGKLTAFAVADGNPVYYTIDGVLCKKATATEPATLVGFPKAKKEPNGNKTYTYVIPDEIKKVGTSAFESNSNINVLDLNNVEELEGVVTSSNSITEVIIGLKLQTIPGGAITGTKLQKYTVRDGNPWLYSYDGALFRTISDRKNNYADFDPVAGQTYTAGTDYWYKLVGVPGSKTGSYTMPKHTLVIGENTFNNKVKITDITFNEELEVVGKEAFYKNSSLKGTLDFSKTHLWKVTTLAFQYGYAKKIVLPKTLEVIQYAAFAYHYALDTLNIKTNSLRTLDVNAFYGLKRLKEVKFEGTNTTCTALGNGLLYYCDSLETVDLSGFQNLPTLKTTVFNGCFSLNNFILPKTVTTIETGVFYNCIGMTNFTFEEPSALKSIGSNTFENTGIVSLTIPESVEKIEQEAFRNCKALKDLKISKNLKEIHPLAFQKCYNITNIDVDEKNDKFSSSDGILLSKDKSKLIIYPAGKTNEKFNMLPPSLTTIGTQAFYANDSLKSIVIPNKVTKIESQAFWQCQNLKVVTLLCDKAIDPDSIGQGTNKWAFTDANGNDRRKDIILYVRQSVHSDYEADGAYKTYYSQFGTNTAAGGAIQKSFIDGTEEYINVSEYAYSLLSVKSKDYTYTIPEKITGPKVGTSQKEELPVMLIGDYAFQDAPDDSHEVVIHSDVEYIGARAFLNKNFQPLNPKVPTGATAATESTISRIFFVSNEPKSLATVRYKLGTQYGTLNYDELTSTQKIFVRKSAVDAYKKGLDAYKDQISYKIMATTAAEKASSDYKYDFINMTSRFGTFSREFDVDLSDYGINIRAFSTGAVIAGAGDNGEVDPNQGADIQWHLKMKHIEYGTHTDGSYIPKNTGVLLALMDNSSKTPDDFYYCIAEDESTTPYAEENTDNVMCSATVNKAFIPTNQNYWVMQGGYFRQVKGNYSTTVNGVNGLYLPAHKSYLKVKDEIIFKNDTPDSNVKLAISLSDTDEPTAITDAANYIADSAKASVYYNIQGVRTNKPAKGFYIKDGKKFVR